MPYSGEAKLVWWHENTGLCVAFELYASVVEDGSLHFGAVLHR